MMIINTISLLGVSIANVTKTDVLEHISSVIRSSKKAMMFYVNANNLTLAYYNDTYRNILNKTVYVYGDGIGVKLAGTVTGQKVIDNVNGTDIFVPLCTMCERERYSIYFLGSKPGVVERMVQNLRKTFPLLMVSGMHHGYFDLQKNSEEIIHKINSSKSNILLVGFGTPTQEEWIFRNEQFINCNIIMGVGGLFDFYSGVKRRAPDWMRRSGFEWSFRLLQEPFRLWRRYIIGIPKFAYIILYEKLRGKEL